MDEKTLSEIVGLAAAAHRELPNWASQTAVVLPASARVESLEHLLDSPIRYKARFETRYIGGFLDYCCQRVDKRSAVFVDPDKMAAHAIMDLGDGASPGCGAHNAALELRETEPFAALIQAARGGRSHTQIGLIDWIEDWESEIGFIDREDGSVPYAQALRSIRCIEIAKQGVKTSERGDMNSSRSTLEDVEIHAADQQPLPAGLKFTCVPYVGFPEITIACRLRAMLDAGDKDLSLHLRLVGFDGVLAGLGQTFQALVEKAIPRDICPVHVGRMTYL